MDPFNEFLGDTVETDEEINLWLNRVGDGDVCWLTCDCHGWEFWQGIDGKIWRVD